ncbi:MAG: hypothetical protein ABMA64_07875 [Myxococcota bacterium]
MVVSLLACGTETGNPEELAFEYNARSSAPEVIGLRSPGSAARVDSVWLRLGPVELTGDCDDERGERSYVGLGFADHADEQPALQQLLVPFDTTCSVALSLEPDASATGEPAGVGGAALALQGTLADGRPFLVRSDEPMAWSFPLRDEPVPEAGAWLLSFDVAEWLDEGALAAVPGDELTVSATENPALLDALLDRVAGGLTLHLDDDRDGGIDPGEDLLAVGE